jgi:hypothetical protein
MNEKIKELAIEAGIPRGHLEGWTKNENYEKFAALLIKECIMLCEEWIDIDQDLRKTWIGVDPEIGPAFCIESIKNHFGVNYEA